MTKVLVSKIFTKNQQLLRVKHGTPAEYAMAVYNAVPGFISMDEAREAVELYNQDWEEAGK